MRKQLLSRIHSRQAKVAVIGLGYVGLPLALGFAAKGFKTFGIDTNRERVQKLLDGKSFITDVTDREISRPVGKGLFVPTVDPAQVRECQAVIICVPTPIKRRYTPDISFMLSAVRAVAKNMSKGTLVVLESTTYPGTTEELILPELEKSGFKAGKDFFLAFSPERIDPGNADHTVTRIPKVVGGLTPACNELTAALYGSIIKNIHLVSSPRAAEMAKLLENTFRLINIGWINEAAMMCKKFNIDIWEAIDAAKTKPFGFMPFYPGLGVGGHCIPEDPIYLYWKAKQHGYASRFIKLSADINSSMPEYAVERIDAILHHTGKKLAGARVLVLGVTYKKDVKDLRKSPSIKLIEVLRRQGAEVSFYDPLVPYLNVDGLKVDGVVLTPRMVAAQDCVAVAVDHTSVDYAMLLKNAKAIFDIRNVYRGMKSTKITRL
ncbi:MAG: nucleotide sugar dehydrogenase [Candidatus Omnitrophica bacterium]|nr:nucleotide sugar dehydrogenase [Candidatus Omnitrophota bacterium]